MLGFVARGNAMAAGRRSRTRFRNDHRGGIPGAAMAGGATNFFVFLGGECVDGGTNPDRTFEVTVKDPNGKIKSRQFIQSNEFGDWGLCFNGRVDTGDTIRTNWHRCRQNVHGPLADRADQPRDQRGLGLGTRELVRRARPYHLQDLR